MLFPTHLLAGYVIGRRWELPALWAVAGAALPDLVDKPLAMAGVSTLYHTVGHSLLALVIGAAVVVVARRRGAGRLRDAVRENGEAVVVGWTSHLVLDAVGMALNGRPGDVRFLAWPVVRHTPEIQLAPVAFLVHYRWTPAFLVEVGLWVACGVAVVAAHWSGGDRQ